MHVHSAMLGQLEREICFLLTLFTAYLFFCHSAAAVYLLNRTSFTQKQTQPLYPFPLNHSSSKLAVQQPE